MIKYMYLTCRFLICIILCEIRVLRTRIGYFHYFLLNINFLKYFFYLFDKNINPLKYDEFLKYIKLNKKKWAKFKKDKKININKKKILIESFVNHPMYTMANILIGKYLQLFYGSQCIGLLRKGDIRAELLFRSYGINMFYFYEFGGFYQRSKYIYKSVIKLKNINSIKKFCNIKFNKIDIGLTSYDSFMRYTLNPTLKKINSKLIIFFAEAWYANDFFEKIFLNSNIAKLVQSEKQFVPLNILFQKSLLKKNEIYARLGFDRLSVRIYTHFNQGYKSKSALSKKLVNEIYKNFKSRSIKKINKYFNKYMKNKFYGQSWIPYVHNKKSIKAFKKDILNKTKYFKSVSKFDLCKIFNWDEKKKIATIFLHALVDGNYNNGKRNLFLDNFTWTNYTLETITKITNINWIIRQHPGEHRYNSKINFSLIVKELEKKYNHIRLFPENLNPASIKELTDIVITSHGSAGLEYPSFGIPSIVAENSYYTNFGFTLQPKNISEYKNLLKNAYKMNKLNRKKTEKAKVFLYIIYILLKNNPSIIPTYVPKFATRIKISDENKFWHQSNQNLRKFNLNKDQFKKMFIKQLYLKLRHTVNFDRCRIKNKIFNDY